MAVSQSNTEWIKGKGVVYKTGPKKGQKVTGRINIVTDTVSGKKAGETWAYTKGKASTAKKVPKGPSAAGGGYNPATQRPQGRTSPTTAATPVKKPVNAQTGAGRDWKKGRNAPAPTKKTAASPVAGGKKMTQDEIKKMLADKKKWSAGYQAGADYKRVKAYGGGAGRRAAVSAAIEGSSGAAQIARVKRGIGAKNAALRAIEAKARQTAADKEAAKKLKAELAALRKQLKG